MATVKLEHEVSEWGLKREKARSRTSQMILTLCAYGGATLAFIRT